MDLGDLNKVWEIKALKKSGEEEARKMLGKIAKQVQPIMKKHKCPNNPSLLGLNVGGGVQVKLRLRKQNKDWDFFPYEQVLDTMLHELCHNAIGPHNASFYKLWDELREECDELVAKGVTGTGEGFDIPGRRLGGFSRQPPLSSLRQTALAERRLQDDLWCGSQSFGVSDEEESSSDMLQKLQPKGWSSECPNSSIIFETLALDTEIVKKSRLADTSKMGQKSSFIDLTEQPSSSGSGDNRMLDGLADQASWECFTCTLLNPVSLLLYRVEATTTSRFSPLRCFYWL